jgi:hypothetical protein
VSASECMVVGDYLVQNYGVGPFAEHWNGSEWQVQLMAKPLTFGDKEAVKSVSCTSSLSCTAVGNSDNEQNVSEHWNGREWTVETMAAVPRGNDYLEGVSCVQPEREVCFAVGGMLGVNSYYEEETVPVPFAESGSATGVGETTATLHGGVNPNGLEAKYYFEYGLTTSYGSKTAEATAGSGTTKVEESKALTSLATNTTYHYRLVATNSKGTAYGLDQTFKTPYWRITPIPLPEKTIDSFSFGMSCTASSACATVGMYTLNANTYMPMADRWNGSEWVLQSPPDPSGSKISALASVSCTSATACMAVGYEMKTLVVPLAMSQTWNGSEWTIQTTPEPSGAKSSYLEQVSCTSSTACTAVGSYENSSGVELPWAARWNGTTWSVQAVPAPTEAKDTYPLGVSCTSATACTMSGYYKNSSSAYVLFAESWNGTEWSKQVTPTPSGAKDSWSYGVSCTSSTACTLVGEYTNSSGVEVTLAERWNGTEWSVQTTPNPAGAKANWLRGVSCASSTACTTVGGYENSAGKDVTLAEQWNGTEWKLQSTPTAEENDVTRDVSCSSPTSCAAGGRAGFEASAQIYG